MASSSGPSSGPIPGRDSLTSKSGKRRIVIAVPDSPSILSRSIKRSRSPIPIPSDDEEEPLPRRQKRPAHQMYPFACPFYRQNKDLYSACLEDEENQVGDIDNIYRHVTRKHRAPDHYCPCCGVPFDNRASCDEHIRGRTCEAIYPAPSFQGLTSQMRVQLDQEFNKPTTGKDDDEKWFRVFNFLFPTERSQGISPYLDADEVRTKTLLSLKVYISERGGHDTRNAMTTMIDEFSEQTLLHSASLGGVITIADRNVGASSAARPGQHVDEDARANAATTTAIRAISTTFRPPISESPWASSLPTGGYMAGGTDCNRRQLRQLRPVAARRRVLTKPTCDACAKSFNHEKSLARHIRLVHRDTEYKCPDCDRIFNQWGLLQSHIRSEHPDTVYKCPDCGRTYTQRSSLKRHIKNTCEGATDS
ncbi:hypothetical protein Z517_08127 [Fonsecaea pedrosoi CBS 271.37]|uniref:C2H2-type domain-containing protein n=1 Tax=Fonsecaea pedrosoi CBS 271.37 TaxID=1442368 RepID=A0A0D2EVM5_9EURO|nr:uncharacterized protein Z517_08127 [Fonsecaea pedrosoi CBS 271.37]KIW78292.1 hypothetical protein Z517_08127 [Fonsecaea pedrosoi CBS 271.37]